MTEQPVPGSTIIRELSGRDLNKDGRIINLVICGDSRFYNYEWVEEQLEQWIKWNAYPDLIILGGASGVDYLAERWAGNYAIPLAIFNEAWNVPRKGLQDHGRPEAPSDLSGRMLERATHLIAFPGPESKWTKVMVEHARMKGIPTAVVPVPEDG
tara:strand:- start:14551 stop:15015 length:465 start_codon:yes stop_codon:yes gene_type:complete